MDREDRLENVVVVGQGYVGLPLAVRCLSVGYRVWGVECDPERLASLLRGDSYIEDVASEELQRGLTDGSFRPVATAAEIDEFDVAVITVPTPLTAGVPDLSFIEDAGNDLAPQIREGATVVLESTTYPGTTLELLAPILEAGSGLKAGVDFFLGYSPERIDPGNRHWDLTNTPKVVSGINSDSLRMVDRFYSSLVRTTVPVSNTGVAELAKLVENTFRHVNIALVNEIAMFAADLGIDVDEVLEAAGTKPFGYLRFNPGPGVGGHCLPIDPSYLSWHVQRRLGIPFRFVELANEINHHMPNYVIKRVAATLNTMHRRLSDSHVLILGLAYKPNTGDCRESPGIAIARLLGEAGSRVRAVDPHVVSPISPLDVELVDLDRQQLDWADVVILVTDHDDIDYDLVARHARFIFDTRRRIEGPTGHLERL